MFFCQNIYMPFSLGPNTCLFAGVSLFHTSPIWIGNCCFHFSSLLIHSPFLFIFPNCHCKCTLLLHHFLRHALLKSTLPLSANLPITPYSQFCLVCLEPYQASQHLQELCWRKSQSCEASIVNLVLNWFHETLNVKSIKEIPMSPPSMFLCMLGTWNQYHVWCSCNNRFNNYKFLVRYVGYLCILCEILED